MINHGVRIYPDSPVLEIRDNGVYVANNRELLFLKADTVVLAVGVEPENKLTKELKDVVPAGGYSQNPVTGQYAEPLQVTGWVFPGLCEHQAAVVG